MRNAQSVAERIVEELKAGGVQGLTQGDHQALVDIIRVTAEVPEARRLLAQELKDADAADGWGVFV